MTKTVELTNDEALTVKGALSDLAAAFRNKADATDDKRRRAMLQANAEHLTDLALKFDV